jgi:hypothetical protein
MIKNLGISFLLLLLLTSCTTYSHQSGNNSNLDTDSRSCKNMANLNAPTYICRNPLMCAPDEIAIAWEAIARNEAYYDQCMLQKGYRAQ